MLIRFTVSNFLSFKDETEFNMLPGKGGAYKQHPNHLTNTKSGIKILKTAAIYGANASGKSNLIKAVQFLRDLILNDIKGIIVPSSKRFKLDESYKSKSSTFRIEYEYKNIHFDYGLEIDKGNIIEEWLYVINSVKKESETLLFKRKNKDVTFGEYYNKIDTTYVKKYLEKKLNSNQCAINAIYNNIDDDSLIDTFQEAMSNLMIVTPDMYNSDYASSIISKEKPKEYAQNILKNSKTGIEELIIKDIPADNFFSYEDEDSKLNLIETFEDEILNAKNLEDPKNNQNTENYGLAFYIRNDYNLLTKKKGEYFVSVLKTKHLNSNNLFDLDEESDGTNRLFELIPAFEHLTSENDYVYIIDELERSMHPILAKELLNLYVHNTSSKSQLIFTTHESHLLDLELLRQDEIWFTEKNIDGSSIFYPLSDFNPREDKNIRLGYLEGRYGGIPFLGDFSKLL